MRTVCENGHELSAEGQKFCGECGSAAKSGDDVACECGATFAKGANFCGACGAAKGPMTGALTEVLDEVDSYIKARAGLNEEDMALPVLDPEESTRAIENVERILKSAAVVDKDTGNEIGVDAVPVVGAFMKSQDELAQATQMYAEHLTDLARAQLDGQTALMKAVVALGRKVEDIAKAPQGPRVLGPAHVGIGGDPMQKSNGARGGEFDNLRGADLLLKATVAAGRNPDLLTTQEIAVVEHFGNNEGSLADMRETHPEIAARVESALRETRAH